MFRKQAGGFVRVKYLGRIGMDKLEMASIEYINNSVELYEKNEL